jgi:RHS repeat-associated protein
VISSTVTDSFRFAGMEWDSEDGLSHTLYRKYTPAQGRWESPDPQRGGVSFPQGQNLYAYVRDNPTNAVDPTGLGVWGCYWVEGATGEELVCVGGSGGNGGSFAPLQDGGGGGGGGGGSGTCTVTQWPQNQYPPQIFAGNECAKDPHYVEEWAWECHDGGDSGCCTRAQDAASKECEEEGRLKGRYWYLEMAPGLEINYGCCCDEGPRWKGPPPPAPPPPPKPKPKPKPH